jgi:hypothetical protein
MPQSPLKTDMAGISTIGLHASSLNKKGVPEESRTPEQFIWWAMQDLNL